MKKFEEWTVAYRKKNEDRLLIDKYGCSMPFMIIKNTWRYWAADPFIFEYNNKTYLFAELYDRICRRGKIGYCEISEGSYTAWRIVLNMPWHLSYPYIFKYDNDIYMIPESYAGNEIAVYKAITFPDTWKRVYIICKNCVAVDSTLYMTKDRTWMTTLQFDDNEPKLLLYSFEQDGSIKNTYVICKNNNDIRPAGKFFEHDNKIIRPAQDCSESYGYAINFYHVTKLNDSDYEEKLICKVLPEIIQSDFHTVPKGIHTYNMSSNYEVIDLKEYRYDMFFYIMRPIWFTLRLCKRFFRR